MKLLTDELRAKLPALYAQSAEADPIVYAKFFLPGTGWTWYVTEGSQEDMTSCSFDSSWASKASSAISCSRSSKLSAARSASPWNATSRSAKAGSPT